MIVVIVAGYWLLLLGLGLTGVWLYARRRRSGLLMFAVSCAVAIATLYEPELDEWLVARSVAHAAPPGALVIRSDLPDDERIAAFASTGFELFIAPREGWLTSAARVAADLSNDCAPNESPPPEAGSKACIHRGEPVPLPGCRVEIKFDGAPDSTEALAQTAQILVVREAGAPCPFYGRQRELPDSLRATRRLLPYVSYFGQPISAVPSMRLTAIVPSPTRDSLLRSLGIGARAL
jgi:hypothetical protein